jgi:DNA-binding GntR family transcriptional regulator
MSATVATPAPLYRTLERDLLREIRRGTYAVGDLLPTEAELCRIHSLSRHTVRAALRRLDELGMIERRAGIGTRVVSNRPIEPFRPIASSPSDILAVVAGTRIAPIETSEVIASSVLARRLRCRPGSRWLRLAGPRVARGQPGPPLCFSEQYLRADLARDAKALRQLERGEFDLRDLQSQRIEQELTAAILDEEKARALDAPLGAPALVVIRRHWSPSRALSAVGVHTHPADRTSIRWDLESESN